MLPIKQWIQGKKQSHHQAAIDDYLVRIRAAYRRDLERRLKRLESRSVIISLDGPEKHHIQGLAVDRNSLLDSTINEQIWLIDLLTNKRVASGRIVDIGQEIVRIKLNERLELEDSSFPSNITSKEEKEEEEEVSNTCEDHDENVTPTTTANNIDKRRFKIVFEDKETSNRLERIEYALHKFKTSACSTTIQKCLLGYYNEWQNVRYNRARYIELKNLIPQPKGYQILAIEQALTRRISLIEGVSGCGKTTIAANIACSIANLRNRKKVLLCSPIQSTVDKLARIIEQVESVTVVQLSNSNSFSLIKRNYFDINNGKNGSITSNTSTGDCMLNSMVEDEIYKKSWQRSLKTINTISDQPIRLHRQAKRAVTNCSSWLREKIEHDILKRANVVCCTLYQAGSRCLRGINFDMLIIDDAHLAPETECLIAMMVKGLEQICLLSEMRREIRLARSSLPVMVSSPKKYNSLREKTSSSSYNTSLSRGNSLPRGGGRRNRQGFDRVRRASERQTVSDNNKVKEIHKREACLFEYFLEIGLSTVALKNQFRMHETLAEFPKYHFYMSRLKTDPKINQQLTKTIKETKFNWLPPNESCSINCLFNTDNIDDTVLDILTKLVNKEDIDSTRIGIITNVNSNVQFNQFTGVDVGSIEHWFGEEKDFVILACYENYNSKELINEQTTLFEIDYLSDSNALNVALTRARMGLFIVADLSYLLDEKENCQPSTSNSIGNDKDKDDDKNITIKQKNYYSKSWRDLINYYQSRNLVVKI